MTKKLEYPWYQLVDGDQLEQGDILEGYPVFSPAADLPHNFDEGENQEPDFDYAHMDLVVMTQSCDLAQEKAPEVLLCPVWKRSDYNEGEFTNPSGWEKARKGMFPAYHVLNRCSLDGFDREHRVVDFRHVYTLPFQFVQARARNSGQRIRLMPPYREHLAQAFARFFMRVGLPVDIPKFK